MPYEVEITELATSRTRKLVFNEDWLDDADGGTREIWEDGNFCCDCNRRIFFSRAGNEEENWDSDCTTGQFRVTCKSMDGQILYSDETKGR